MRAAWAKPFLSIGWTLNFEAFFYIIYTFSFIKGGPKGVAGLIGVVGIMSLLGRFISVLPLSFWFDPIILEFAIGMAVGLIFASKLRVPPWALASLVLIGVILLLISAILGYRAGPPDAPSVPPRWLVWGIPSGMIVFGCASLKQLNSTIGRLIARLGDASYSLYLLHIPVLVTMKILRIFPILNGTFSLLISELIFLSIFFGATTLISDFAYHYIEIPCTRLFVSRSGPNHVATQPAG